VRAFLPLLPCNPCAQIRKKTNGMNRLSP
jgi:hypothetical protein